jgi:hypothetical protein
LGEGSPHLCLGDLLARTEIRVMFEELIPRLADIRLVGDIPRVRSNFIDGIKKPPVEVTLARVPSSCVEEQFSAERVWPSSYQSSRRTDCRITSWVPSTTV